MVVEPSVLWGTRQAAAESREVWGLNITKAGAVAQWDKREHQALQQPTAGAGAWSRAAVCIWGA